MIPATIISVVTSNRKSPDASPGLTILIRQFQDTLGVCRMQSIDLANKITQLLDGVPHYTATASLKIAVALIDERSTKAICSLSSLDCLQSTLDEVPSGQVEPEFVSSEIG
jgi:hypothetical protein